MRFSRSQRANLFLKGLTVAAIFASIALVLAISVLLRPVADDYAHGASAVAGFWSATTGWWLGWSGDLSLIVGQVLLVGMPLAWLPLEVTSSVGFVFSGFIVGGLGAVALGLVKHSEKWPVISVWALITLSWWVFLWARQLAVPDFENRRVAEYLTHWQTVNVAYVIFPAINVVVFLFLVRGALSRGKLAGTIALFLGFISGTSGLVMGVALAAFGMLIVVAKSVTAG